MWHSGGVEESTTDQFAAGIKNTGYHYQCVNILVWIRIWIRGSMPLSNGSRSRLGCGSGSCYFRHWSSRCQQKTNLKKVFLLITLWRRRGINKSTTAQFAASIKNTGYQCVTILVWNRIRIWIRGSMPLTNGSRSGLGCGSGSCYFRHWSSRCQQKTNLKKNFLLITFWRCGGINKSITAQFAASIKNTGYQCVTILVWIRIPWFRGSMPLTNGSRSGFGCGSGSCYFRYWSSRCQRKLIFCKSFSAYYFLKVHFYHFSKIKSQKDVTKQ